MKKIIWALVIVAVLLVPGCCAVNKLAAEKNLKAWKHIGAEYRDYVQNDDSLETAEDKEDILLPLDEAILHAEEMVLTLSGEDKKEGEE